MPTLIDERLPRYVISSFVDHVKKAMTSATPSGIQPPKKWMFEGEDHVDRLTVTELVECAIIGPDFHNPSSDAYSFDVKLRLTIRVAKSLSNLYRIHDLGGLCLRAMTTVPIFPYTASPLPPNTAPVFCMQPDSNEDRTIKYRYFGQIEPAVPLLEAQVYGVFRIVNLSMENL